MWQLSLNLVPELFFCRLKFFCHSVRHDREVCSARCYTRQSSHRWRATYDIVPGFSCCHQRMCSWVKRDIDAWLVLPSSRTPFELSHRSMTIIVAQSKEYMRLTPDKSRIKIESSSAGRYSKMLSYALMQILVTRYAAYFHATQKKLQVV